MNMVDTTARAMTTLSLLKSTIYNIAPIRKGLNNLLPLTDLIAEYASVYGQRVIIVTCNETTSQTSGAVFHYITPADIQHAIYNALSSIEPSTDDDNDDDDDDDDDDDKEDEDNEGEENDDEDDDEVIARNEAKRVARDACVDRIAACSISCLPLCSDDELSRYADHTQTTYLGYANELPVNKFMITVAHNGNDYGDATLVLYSNRYGWYRYTPSSGRIHIDQSVDREEKSIHSMHQQGAFYGATSDKRSSRHDSILLVGGVDCREYHQNVHIVISIPLHSTPCRYFLFFDARTMIVVAID
jgi:hypothetical protein